MESKFWDGSPILASDVLAEAKRLSVEFPERIGRSEEGRCVYTEYDRDGASDNYGEPTKPVCIVGTAVYNLTGKFVPVSFEGFRIGTNDWRIALSAYDLDSFEKEHRAWSVLLDAQIRQDSRRPWGELFEEPETEEE